MASSDITPDASPPRSPFMDWARGWMTTVDHKRLGVMYISSALLFFVVGGLEASAMRAQLSWSQLDLMEPGTFNTLFTMHGTTMVFLVGMPMLFGFANYLIPLMIGSRDLAFPRLNAVGFWIFFFSGCLLYYSSVGGEALYGLAGMPDVGWFAYAPLTAINYSPGNGPDYWLLFVLVGGIGSLATALNVVVTVATMRCEGMTPLRMPLLVWMISVACGLVLIAMPPLSAASIMMLFDRHFGSHFFDTQGGGSAVFWQHLFWFFGHPEVYILVLPGFAIVSEIIPVFSRKAIFGYPMMVAASVCIGVVAMGVWVHHMFTVGLTAGMNSFFAASTMIIAVPTGIKIFNWIGTMYGGRLHLKMPMLCCVAFLFQFLCAGLTGIMLAIAPFDFQLSDSYFVVAHFHFVLIGGLLFAIFGGLYYWFPKATGRMLGEKLGRWHFWLFLIGFNVTFGFMHIPGAMGMPRRIYTYQADRGWEIWNVISSAGVVLQAAGVCCLLVNIIRSARKGAVAGDDPWDAWTLEWATTSPPPEYNFEKPPKVHSRRPLWDLKHPDDTDGAYE
ncbi:MAG: cytochrome c oxidase subunit I [Planctomycetota bacterium]|jgi:cytochrome c oxidase subunit I|nr:cytochrome c oxidase subunit I [Planctomycetota bacterium]